MHTVEYVEGINDKSIENISNEVHIMYVFRLVLCPGWVLPYLGMVGTFRGDDPHFGDFQSDVVLILYLNTIRLTHSFSRKKISLSLSQLVPEIL